jgi:hypothetical protein
MAYPEQYNSGLFIPTTNIWDVLPQDANSVTVDIFKELLVRLHQNMNNISSTTNLKDSGYYVLEEFVNGQSFFPNPALTPADGNYLIPRQVFRKVINFGTLPNAGLKSVAHGITITSAFSFTRIYATASNPAGLIYFPIPGSGCDITVDSTNVNITTGANKTAFTQCYVVIEYLKQ